MALTTNTTPRGLLLCIAPLSKCTPYKEIIIFENNTLLLFNNMDKLQLANSLFYWKTAMMKTLKVDREHFWNEIPH